MRMIRLFLLAFALAASAPCLSQQVTDWGVIPLDQDTTISFASYDKTGNFTDQYTFSLQGFGDASYAVTVLFGGCKNGCGNIDLSYGVYGANGSLIDESGSVVLSAGDYVFMVKGTGMGAGNHVGYEGTMNFFVAAVPEPADYLLMAAGLGFLVWAVLRRRRAQARAAGVAGRGAAVWELRSC